MDEDIKYFIYLVFVVIYIISRAFKKKKPKRQAPTTSESTVAPESPVTFEDLLREFGADIPKKEEAPEEPDFTYSSETIPVSEPEPEPEPPRYTGSDQYAREIYERSIQQASYKTESRRHSLLKEDSEFERDDHYKITTEENIFYKKLHNPQTLIDAVIFNEILNRKY